MVITSRIHPVLLHATSWISEILDDGYIAGNPIRMSDHVPGGRAHIGMKGVCTTRSQIFAKLYAPAILVLDREKIRQKYKIILRAEEAYDSAHYGEYRMEAEEFIPCDRLGIEKYCHGFWIDFSWNDECREKIEKHSLFKGFFKGHHG